MYRGSSRTPTTRMHSRKRVRGRRAFQSCCEGSPARGTGAFGRENVGISNHKSDEKSDPQKSKVSVAMAINHGLGDPKAMMRIVADGKPVNIPARLAYSMG